MLCRLLLALVLLVGWSANASADEATHHLHSFTRQKLSDRFFAEGATYGDLNNDKHADLVAGPFWYEGPTFEKQNVYYPPKPFDPQGYSDNFFAYVEDLNADGWNDILIYGFPGKDASWFENPKGEPDGEWKRHVVLKQVDNESPTWTDLNDDGKREVVCSVDGYFGFAEPNQKNPDQPWQFRRISDKSAGGNFTHGLGVGDVNGDRRLDLLEKTGWWEQPESLDGDPVWKKHPVAFAGQGGAQMYAYDVDGDGLNDVITSLQAHGVGLVWYKQLKGEGEPKFEAQTITGATAADNPYGVTFSEIHAIDLADIDGDGLKDIITGKRYWAHGAKGDPNPDAPAVIYWFKLVRQKDGTVDWVPHLIDDDSGVGVQVVAGDFSGDGKLDVVVSNKKGTFAHTQVVKEVSKEAWQQQPRRREKMADGLSGEEAARAMTLPPGFRVDLCAAEPDVCQPIAMAYDDRGRLWVAEAYGYPVRLPEDQARDRILIFEDTDGDNKFDKRTVFIEGLNLVSGLELGFGGVWVGAAPHLLFIPDKDRDDRPDAKPQVLLDGWGYEDTHETLNAFIWGPDGWLYGCHGVFTHSNVGKPGAADNDRKRINAGIWRYHPTRHEFEVFAEGTSNPWGVDFNDRGHAFCTACVIPHLYHVIQGARYQRQAGQHFNQFVFDDIKTIANHRHWVGNQWNNEDRAKSDSIGGGHAHAGAMIYLGGAWPKRYRDQLFMHNIHGSRINQDKLSPNGSGYVGDAAPDFCFANDIWSQMIYLTYGPDGQVTMIDWYDRNQCHHKNVEGHDRGNGRIYKISYGDAKPVKVDLQALSDADLISNLEHSNEWFVRHSRRILQERAANKTLSPETPEHIRKQLASGTSSPARLRALWALHATGALTPADQRDLLADKDADVRAWAVQLACEAAAPEPKTLAVLQQMAAKDDSPVVRLYLASALQRLPIADRWEIAAALTQHASDAADHNLPLVIWYGVEPLVMTDTKRAMQLAGSSQIPLVSRFIARRAAAEPAGYDALLSQLTAAREADQLWMLDEIVAALKVRANQEMPKAWSAAYEKLAASKNETIQQQAEYVAVKFGDQRVLPQLRSTLMNRKLPLARRKLALESLLVAKDSELPGLLQALLDDADLRNLAISGLAAFDDPATPDALVKAYENLPAADKQAAIATLTSRPPYILALLDAIEAKQIPRNDLTAFTVRQIARLDNQRVNQRLTEVWGAIRETSADKAAEIATYRKLLRPETLKLADLQQGRQVFTKTCGSCHTLFSSGKNIGPDLTGSNRANLDYVLENVLDPSAVVGKDYQMTVILSADGRSISGILKNETDSAITLQTPTEVVTIAKDELEERKLSPLSLMPDGQLKEMKPEEIRDLVAYLASPMQVPLPGEGPWQNPQTGKVNGAIEGETLKTIEKSRGATGSQPMNAFTLDKWSGDSHLWWTGAKPGDTLVLEVPAEKEGTYEVFISMTKAVDYGIVTLAINGSKPTQPINLFNDGVVNTPPVSLGVHDLKAGANRLTVKIEGADPKAAKAYMFGIDYVALVPQTDK